MNDKKVYWQGELGPEDDFGKKYDNVMYDGKTRSGPWANMSYVSWVRFGVGKLGTGYGQRYERQANGRWLKVEG